MIFSDMVCEINRKSHTVLKLQWFSSLILEMPDILKRINYLLISKILIITLLFFFDYVPFLFFYPRVHLYSAYYISIVIYFNSLFASLVLCTSYYLLPDNIFFYDLSK